MLQSLTSMKVNFAVDLQIGDAYDVEEVVDGPEGAVGVEEGGLQGHGEGDDHGYEHTHYLPDLDAQASGQKGETIQRKISQKIIMDL